MEMPTLKPLAIKTKNESFVVRFKRWITYVRKWEVASDWTIRLPGDRGIVVVVPAGFIFDGASIPKPLWGLLSPTGLLLIPGLIHDFAYRYDYLWAIDENGNFFKFEEQAGRKYWDKLFMEVGLDVNGMKIIDRIAWFALLLGGKAAWNNNRKRNESEVRPSPQVEKGQPYQGQASSITRTERELETEVE